MKDPPAVRLGGLAADLRRISSASRRKTGDTQVMMMLEESQYLIEWTAQELEAEAAAELVNMQVMLSLWRRSWPTAQHNMTQRTLLAIQARSWSDRVLTLAGLK